MKTIAPNLDHPSRPNEAQHAGSSFPNRSSRARQKTWGMVILVPLLLAVAAAGLFHHYLLMVPPGILAFIIALDLLDVIALPLALIVFLCLERWQKKTPDRRG